MSLLLRRKFVLSDAAFRAHPVVRQIVKSRSGLDAVVGISLVRIVDIATDIANVLLHSHLPLFSTLHCEYTASRPRPFDPVPALW